MHRNREPVNVLLVDDQPAKLLSYEVILEELGENLIKASSGRKALEQLLRQDVAVILVDVAMPELDGFELAAMIRDHPRFAQTAIIFVSAVHLSELDSLRGYEAGAVDYLPVPVVPELLRAKVRIFCDLFRKTRQLETLNAELERRVEARTAELAGANAELEKRVEARTREREEALAQIAEMQKLESLGQLTGGLAHDFNNLLMVVMSNLELARKRIAGDDRATLWLERATEAAARGAALTKRMLAFARRQDLKPETLALSEAVKGVAEMMSHSLGPSVRINVDVSSDLPAIRIDRNQLELVLLNLGLNARDAMPDGGQLLITAKPADEAHLPEKIGLGTFVLLKVKDTGIGMEVETLRRASEPFFSTKPAGKGSGLGLSMVHGLMLQSGGAMRIESTAGEGTTVWLWLPTSDDTIEAARPTAVLTVDFSCRNRVLIVDDDPLVLSVTADMLRELGHEPISVGTAKEAIEILRTGETPNLAILDYAMPDMSGVALAELIRDTCPKLPLLLATGFSEGDKAAPSLPRLDKPYTLSELARQIGLLVLGPKQQTGAADRP
jgi:signal transduction histidine kinase